MILCAYVRLRRVRCAWGDLTDLCYDFRAKVFAGARMHSAHAGKITAEFARNARLFLSYSFVDDFFVMALKRNLHSRPLIGSLCNWNEKGSGSGPNSLGRRKVRVL